MTQDRALGEDFGFGGDECRANLDDRHLHPLGAGCPHTRILFLRDKRVQKVGGAHVTQFASGSMESPTLDPLPAEAGAARIARLVLARFVVVDPHGLQSESG